MRDRFPAIEKEDEVLTDYRRAGEFDAQIKRGLNTFRLVLDRENSEIIARHPIPGRVRLKPNFNSAIRR